MDDADIAAMAVHYEVEAGDLRTFLDHLEAHATGLPPPGPMADFMAVGQRLEFQVGPARFDIIRRRLVRLAGLNMKVR